MSEQPGRSAAAAVIDFLEARTVDELTPRAELFGFGGLHGGLMLGHIANREDVDEGSRVIAITGHFHRAVRQPVTVRTSSVRSGAVATTDARIVSETQAHVTATVISAPTSTGYPVVSAPGPPARIGAPGDWDVFSIPPEFVPVGAATEIRPVGAVRPYQGASRAELTAWVRILDDRPVTDVGRFTFLMDALAPSYAAVMTELAPIPTIELSVRPSADLVRTATPWVLLQARTDIADGSGWSQERIDAWDEDGLHLGVATQLRVARRR